MSLRQPNISLLSKWLRYTFNCNKARNRTKNIILLLNMALTFVKASKFINVTAAHIVARQFTACGIKYFRNE